MGSGHFEILSDGKEPRSPERFAAGIFCTVVGRYAQTMWSLTVIGDRPGFLDGNAP